jgi:hypothetical protein
VICDPPADAWTALGELFVNYTSGNGIDLFIGRRLPRLLRDAGLIDIHVNPTVHVHPPGDARRCLLLDFAENLRERILAENLIDEEAYDDLKRGLRRHIEDPDTLVMIGPYVQVWGRNPK